ncbi:Uncharacterized protein SCF082_LOCUS48128 [Durusdinium trenchii]|uniref:Uncharacterized protein n=1 Tax=Durusdinium trenchii TaxID=1381693 RepID=A0ABP0RRV5_9DINO
MASGAGKKARKQKETEAEEAPALSASATAARHLQNLRRKSEEPGASLAKEPAESAEAIPKSNAAEEAPVSTGSSASPPKASWTPQLEAILRTSMMMVLLKNFSLFLLLAPTAVGECQEERLCMPVVSMLILFIDLSVCTGHLMLGFFDPAYRQDFLFSQFWLMAVLWSLWNVLSHPFWRDNIIDIFIVWPEELHTLLNMATVLAFTFTQTMPSWRHLACLIIGEFLLSLALSAAEAMSRMIEAVDGSESNTVRVDLVIFNIAILIIGSTIVLGSLGPDKDADGTPDGLSLASTLRSQAFEDDLQRRKRAVLTALCDTVLTTNAHFAIILSNDSADKLFKRPMLHELFTDYFKDGTEKAKFLASMKKQFVHDDSSDGPRRLRVTMRDANNKPFEADVVVSDASTDVRTGKVLKLMVGMHVRPEHRSQAMEAKRWSTAGTDPPQASALSHPAVGRAGAQGVNGLRRARDEKRSGPAGQAAIKGVDEQRQSHRDFSKELLSMYVDFLRSHPSSGGTSGLPAESNGGPEKGHSSRGAPRIRLHRSNYESFRRRQSTSSTSPS